MAKLEVKKTDVKEKSYRVIAKCPHGKNELVYIKQFNKQIVAPVFVGSTSCQKCEFFGGYLQSDPYDVMFIDCKCETKWQKLKRNLKSCLQWLVK